MTLNEMLEAAAAAGAAQPTPVAVALGAQKQQAVQQASAEKQAALGGLTKESLYAPSVGTGTNKGVNSASELEYDSRYLTPTQLDQKYGQAATNRFSLSRAAADQRVLGDTLTTRNLDQTAADLTTSVGLGMANSIGGIGALGLGVLNKNAGLFASQKLEDLNNFGQSTQSEALQAKRRLLAAKNQLDERDSTQQYLQDVASGKSELTSSLARVGRDVLTSVSNAASDPITLSDGTAQGVGSLLGISPVSALLKKAGGAVAKYGTPLAIGAIEGGGSYQQSANEVMGMNHEQLLKTSPDYASMILRGVAPAEAQATLANRTGLTAAAYTIPAAIAAGKLVDGFASDPLNKVTARAAVGNLGRETIEEGVQGGAGQLAQNQAIQSFADNTKTLSEGVGGQIGTGALYGLGTAGVVQAPSLVGGAAGSAIKGAVNYLGERADKILAKYEADSPVSINRAVEQAASLIQDAPAISAKLEQTLAPVVTDTPEVAAAKATALADFPGFIAALQINDSERQSYIMKPVADVIASVQTRPEAVAAIIEDLKKEKDPQTRFAKTVALQVLVNTAFDSTDKLGGLDSDLLPEDAGKLFTGVMNMNDLLVNSPEVLRELQNAGKFLETDLGKKLLNDMNQTPESAQGVATIVAGVVDRNPNDVAQGTVQTFLNMAKDGRIRLTEKQTAALESANALVQAAKDYNAELIARGEKAPKDAVTNEVTTYDRADRNVLGSKSGLQHMNSVRDLINQGDVKTARIALEMLGNFAQSQANKVAAINNQYAEGRAAQPRPVDVLLPDGLTFAESSTPYGIKPDSVGSVRFAHRITAEARFLTQLYNSLATTYPQLKGKLKPTPELDAAFQGRSADVAAEFESKVRKYPEESKLTKPEAVVPLVPATPAAPVVKAKKESKPKAVKEPKPFKISVAVKNQSTKKLEERLTTETRPNILEQVKAELEIRKNKPTPEKSNVTETTEAIKTEPNQTTKATTSGPSTTGTTSVTTAKKPDSKSVYAEKITATLLDKEKVLDAVDSGDIDPNSTSAAEYTAEVEFKQALQKVVKASGEFINRVQRFGTNYALRLQDKQDALSAELKDSEGVTDTDTAISLLRDVVAYMAEHEAKQGQLFEEGPPATSVDAPIDAPLPWETDEEFAARTKKNSATTPKNPKNTLFDKDNVKSTTDAIRHIFDNSRLGKLGNFEQYLKYLRNVYKGSLVDNVVFHYAESGKLNADDKVNKDESALFFFDDVRNAQNWSDWTIQGGPIVGKIFAALVNVVESSNAIIDGEELSGFEVPKVIEDAWKSGKKTAIIENITDWGTTGRQIAINNSAYHVLGSKEDLKGFRAYIEGKTTNVPVEPITATQAELNEAKRVMVSTDEDITFSGRIGELINAINDEVEIKIVPEANQAVAPVTPEPVATETVATGPLPWETDEEYATRIAAEKVGIPSAQGVAVVDPLLEGFVNDYATPGISSEDDTAGVDPHFDPNEAQQEIITKAQETIAMVFDIEVPRFPVRIEKFLTFFEGVQASFDTVGKVLYIPKVLFLSLLTDRDTPEKRTAMHLLTHESMHGMYAASRATGIINTFNQEYVDASQKGKELFDRYALTYKKGAQRDSEIFAEIGGYYFSENAILRDQFPETVKQYFEYLSNETKTPLVEPRTAAQQKQIDKLKKEIEIYDTFLKCLGGK